MYDLDPSDVASEVNEVGVGRRCLGTQCLPPPAQGRWAAVDLPTQRLPPNVSPQNDAHLSKWMRTGRCGRGWVREIIDLAEGARDQCASGANEVENLHRRRE